MEFTRLLPLTLLFALPVVAAENAGPAQLPDVVVTPARSARSADELPFTTARIDAADLQLGRMSRTTPEALKEFPAVLVQKTGHGQGSPFVRGFTGYHTLFLVDGIRLNNSTFRSGPNQYWSTVDSFSYDRLELLKGSASMQYGSDAVGGVAQAVTADPFEAAGPEGSSARLHLRGASAERSLAGRLESAVASGDTAFRAGVTLRDYGDLESGGSAGRLRKTGYDEWAADAGLALRLSEQWRLDAVHQTLEQDDAWRTHSTPFAKSFRGTKVGSDKARILDQTRHLTYARLSGEDLTGALSDASVTLSLHRQGEREFRVRKDDTEQYTGTDVDTFGAQAQGGAELGETMLTFGVDYYHDTVDSFSRRQKEAGGSFKNAIQGPVADDSSYDSLGLFVQDEFKVAADTRAIAGARYTRSSVDAGRFEDPATGDAASYTHDWDNVSFSGRLLHDVAKDASLFAGVSQGFRAPNLSDLTRFDVARSEEVEIASTDLDAEQFLSFEAGARLHGERAFTGQLSVFHTLIDDLIQRTPTGESNEDGLLVRKTNSGDGYVQGVEAEGRLELAETLSLRGMITWMKGEIDSYVSSEPVLVEDNLSRVMPLTGQIALRHTPSDKGWVELVFAAGDDQDNLSDSDRRDTERIPPGGNVSYEVFTLRGNVALADDVDLSLAVENLFDTEYRLLGSGVNEPGRNFVAAVDVRF
jgi:hemoglobin/transferrin/lactoferrin receptor protein